MIIRVPDLAIQFPFFSYSPHAESIHVTGSNFSLGSNIACKQIELEVFLASLFLLQAGNSEFSSTEIAELLRLRDTRFVAAAFTNLNNAIYYLKTRDRVYDPFSLLTVNEEGKTRNRRYSVNIAAAFSAQLEMGDEISYLQVNLAEYLKIPAGLPRRLWLFCENKRRNPNFPGYIAMKTEVFCAYMPINNAQSQGKVRTLRNTLRQLTEIGYCQYTFSQGEWKITFMGDTPEQPEPQEMIAEISHQEPARKIATDVNFPFPDLAQQKENNHLREKNTLLEDKNAHLESENALLREQLANLTQQIAMLNTQVQKLLSQNTITNANQDGEKQAKIANQTSDLPQISNINQKDACHVLVDDFCPGKNDFPKKATIAEAQAEFSQCVEMPHHKNCCERNETEIAAETFANDENPTQISATGAIEEVQLGELYYGQEIFDDDLGDDAEIFDSEPTAIGAIVRDSILPELAACSSDAIKKQQQETGETDEREKPEGESIFSEETRQIFANGPVAIKDLVEKAEKRKRLSQEEFAERQAKIAATLAATLAGESGEYAKERLAGVREVLAQEEKQFAITPPSLRGIHLPKSVVMNDKRRAIHAKISATFNETNQQEREADRRKKDEEFVNTLIRMEQEGKFKEPGPTHVERREKYFLEKRGWQIYPGQDALKWLGIDYPSVDIEKIIQNGKWSGDIKKLGEWYSWDFRRKKELLVEKKTEIGPGLFTDMLKNHEQYEITDSDMLTETNTAAIQRRENPTFAQQSENIDAQKQLFDQGKREQEKLIQMIEDRKNEINLAELDCKIHSCRSKWPMTKVLAERFGYSTGQWNIADFGSVEKSIREIFP